jgi:hypothetical protein
VGDLGPDLNAAFEASLAELELEVGAACGGDQPWPRRVVAALHAAFAYAAREPEAARVLTLASKRDRDDGAEAAERLNATFAEQLRKISGDLSGSEGFTEQALIGGVVNLVGQRVSLGNLAALPSMSAEVAQFLLIPYLGNDQARRVVAEELH